MSPFAWLGLDEGADERAVKRAYAARLRVTRPEDDPQGFQALHAAYQAALAGCRRRQEAVVAAGEPIEPLPLPQPSPTRIEPPTRTEPVAPPPAVPPARFAMDAFVAEVFVRADAGEPRDLHAWLCGVEALWSLELKARTGHALLLASHRQAPPMPARCLDVLLSFFGLDNTLAGHDPLALHQLRQRIDLAWRLAPERRKALASDLRITGHKARRTLDRVLLQLQRPFRWPQVLLRGLLPEWVNQAASVIQRLSGGQPALLPPSFDRRQLAFWLAAADSRSVSRPRLALAGARTLAMLSLSLPLGLFFGWVADSSHIDPAAVGITALVVASLCLFVFLMAAWSQLVRWQAGPAPTGRWPGRLHVGLVPLLAGTGLAMEYLADAPFAGWPALLVATWLATARVLRSQQIPGGVRRWVWIGVVVALPLARVLAQSNVEPEWFTGVFAAVALGAWGIDLWRQRRRLRPALPAR